MPYEIIRDDCFHWLRTRERNSIHAVVTDPPFGVLEFRQHELEKLKKGRGGVWRIPPKIGGSVRAPLPRFTVLGARELQEVSAFFHEWGRLIHRVLVPGAHVFVASNSLLSPIVFSAIVRAGLEPRGQIIRLVRTFRGGDRPKNAEIEFANVSTLPRACHEPWGIFRKPCDGKVSENLRLWKTGGIQRLSEESPFPDVIESVRTPKAEKELCPHPSLKPQEFMRKVVKIALPLAEGIVLDPFMGGGSTIAAAEYNGYESIGIEMDQTYYALAQATIPRLAELDPDRTPIAALV